MDFATMVQEVKNIVQDETFDASIAGYINDAFLQASGRINIPDLKRIGVANTTSAMYTSLSGLTNGFGGRLSKMINRDLLRFDNIEDMTDWINSAGRSLTENGAVEAVALEGKNLWYFPTPSTKEMLQCIVFSNPAVMEDDDDEPYQFPEVCHRNIGIHGAAYLCYLIIEDGVDGVKTNTTFHYSLFEKGITQLLEWVGRHRVHRITSTLNDEVATTNFNSRWSHAI